MSKIETLTQLLRFLCKLHRQSRFEPANSGDFSTVTKQWIRREKYSCEAIENIGFFKLDVWTDDMRNFEKRIRELVIGTAIHINIYL